MRRNVYLQGELGKKFGEKFVVECTTLSDIFKCLSANRPSFRKYLLECEEQGIDFSVEFQGETLEADELLVPVKEGDVTISIVPAGSKKLGKIIAAAFLVFVVLPAMGAAAAKASGTAITGTGANGAITMGDKIAAGIKAKGGTFVSNLATNLALVGLHEIMAQDPSVDDSSPTNYMLDGDTQNIVEGDPIPVLYGRLKVPGRPISMNVNNYESFTIGGRIMDSNGNVSTSIRQTLER